MPTLIQTREIDAPGIAAGARPAISRLTAVGSGAERRVAEGEA